MFNITERHWNLLTAIPPEWDWLNDITPEVEKAMEERRQAYSLKDVRKIFGIKRGRIREWLLEQFITPTVPSEGQGIRNEFTPYDLYRIYLFKELINNGISRKTAKLICNILNDSAWNMETGGMYVTVPFAYIISFNIRVNIENIKVDVNHILKSKGYSHEYGLLE